MLEIVTKAAKIVGGGRVPNYSALAQAIHCNRSNMYRWRKVPVRYCGNIVDVTGRRITLHQLRPDVFRK